MKSKQVNFYIEEQDVVEFDQYLKQNNYSIIGQPMLTKEVLKLSSLSDSRYGENLLQVKKFIVLNEHIDQITLDYIQDQNYYLVNEYYSPVIEFIFSNISKNNKKKPGRLYYIKSYGMNETENQIKPEMFIESADKILKWFRKKFSYTNLENHKDVIVSERVSLWLQEEHGVLEFN